MSKPAQNSIEVDVRTAYVEEQSKPAESHYVFAYSITIRNTGQSTARLISRHWLITDANGGVQEVFGEGVVGQQPLLRPGEDFSYTSGTTLPTPVGTMQGSYQMETDSGEQFEAIIAPFSLALPHMLH
ncbi:Co2+/Mg2+ efflux protein ApaG [Sedimenticola thiotaurini]|uniref:Protein ApaG n=1 Tax=Sedimenticola thiotaurini TaxID=1543721 RepID=A0A0F7K0C3_9GAMM|nr:Co2+/Mg2+ efflux protein ApaG [Sedimenticola thiotaurini]AKH21312.1 magnesium transporter ApaG [Sedimenticola thiotaurini]